MLWALFLFLSGQFDTAFHDGLLALNRNDLPAAESNLETAAKLEPGNARVWLALAQTYWKLDRAADARAAALRAESGAGSDPVVLRSLSLIYNQLLRARPYDESAYFDLARLQLKQEDFATALATTEASKKYFDRSAQLTLTAGVALYGLRRFPEAIDAFLQTIALDPTPEQPYVFLGRMIDQAEDRLPRVAAALAAFARRAPDNYLATFLYGKSLSIAGDPAAETTLRKSIAQNSGYWESHYELGVLLARDHKYETAAAELRRAIELNPGDAAPHYHLARVYDRLGKSADADAERQTHARLTETARKTPGMAGGIK